MFGIFFLSFVFKKVWNFIKWLNIFLKLSKKFACSKKVQNFLKIFMFSKIVHNFQDMFLSKIHFRNNNQRKLCATVLPCR